MVDFQSRERRTRGDDEEPDTSTEESEQAGDQTDEPSETEAEPTVEETAEQVSSVGIAVVTITDERTVEADPVGDAVIEALSEHELVTRELLGRDHDSVQQAIDALVGRRDVDAVVTAGGTGVDPRDITIEAVHPLFEKALPGFGELFRQRYHELVGTDVIATRATAGIADGTPVFCLPDSAAGARLGASEIITEQAARLSQSGDGESV